MRSDDQSYLRLALRLARRGFGMTSPNPMVGAVLVRGRRILGKGWHHRAGAPHAEVEAIHDTLRRGGRTKGATLYVTLEPCCSHGRTPPCTEAIIQAGIRRVIVGATDPNPQHRGKAYSVLRRAGIKVMHGNLAAECARLNESFNHWIVRGTPFVTVKVALTMDGKIATSSGESKWITSKKSRGCAMKLRQGADAILVGVNTILTDDPNLTVRDLPSKGLRRIVLDAVARTPLNARVVRDAHAALTTIVVTRRAPKSRVAALGQRVRVLVAPVWKEFRLNRNQVMPAHPLIDLRWLLRALGTENVTSLLVEGGGEVNASFLMQRLAHRVVFFYAPKLIAGKDSIPAVGGQGISNLKEASHLVDVEWQSLGPDLVLNARIQRP